VHAWKLDSTSPTPLLFASISLSNQGRYREADSLAQLLASRRNKLSPFYQDWLDYRLALLSGDRPKALVAVRRLAGRAPGSKATYNLAVEALENGFVDEALGALKSLPVDRGAMRGWIPYWELLGSAHHLKGDYRAELSVGAKARSRYPDRLYAFIPSLRALTALGRDAEVQRLLAEAARLSRDPYGTTLGGLLREVAEEAIAHNRGAEARRYLGQSLRWYTDRAKTAVATRADTLTAANLLYALERWAEAAALLGPSPKGPEEIGLAGLIAARRGQPGAARAAAARLAADRTPYQFGAPFLAEARIAAVLGDTAVALTALQDAFKSGHDYEVWIHRTREFAVLRSNPAFMNLVHLKR
jgi:hypothetical protein